MSKLKVKTLVAFYDAASAAKTTLHQEQQFSVQRSFPGTINERVLCIRFMTPELSLNTKAQW